MEQASRITLGLDIGSESLGWALVEWNGEEGRIIRSGVRIFEAGMEGDLDSGKAASRAVERRNKRLLRRQTDRRARRRQRLLGQLVRNGLLPEDIDQPGAFTTLDRKLREDLQPQLAKLGIAPAVLPLVFPYALRTLALDQPLPPHAIGRAIYHLGQRRGFKSNRKAVAKDDEGVVKTNIAQLNHDMAEGGARTLGEYLARLDPHHARLRSRYTHRDMYTGEFEAIWNAQSAFGNPLLTPELKSDIQSTIFFQRPLRSAGGQVGSCILEPKARRCPWFHLSAQEFRILQTVNNLRVIEPDGANRPLDHEEWERLVAALRDVTSLECTKARSLLGLPRKAKFSIEEGGEKKLLGNRTRAAMLEVFGTRWNQLSADEQDQVCLDVHSMQDDGALYRRAISRWELSPQQAGHLCQVHLEDGYCSLSRRAIERLLPAMREGLAYASTIVQVYGEFHFKTAVASSLPMLTEALPELRNPAVARSLNEVRAVVNAVLREHGLPDQIHVELARNLKSGNREKLRLIQKNRDNEKARESARRQIQQEMNIDEPSPTDILKVQLAKECSWTCPYSGREITMLKLFGPNPEFEIEHIVPFSRSLDDSFVNKTLCHIEQNRRKGNRTPKEAFGRLPEFTGMLGRVKRFHGTLGREKLRRFECSGARVDEEFLSRKLNDTRLASRLAIKYLASLYGGEVDGKGNRRVFAVGGGVTWYTRAIFGMNAILGDGDRKTREDHRHHAVDAVAIALSDTAVVQRVANLAKQMESRQLFTRFRVPEVQSPWPGFLGELRESVAAIVPSHRQGGKVRGSLHEDTLYGVTGTEGEAVVRKTLGKNMSAGDVLNIADPVVRQLVLDKLAELGEQDPAKAFQDDADLPRFPDNGPRIRSARIRINRRTVPIGEGPGLRNVVAGANHHMEIVAVLAPDGTTRKWEGKVTSLMESVRRKRAGEPVVQRDHSPGRSFVFSLRQGDVIQVEPEPGKRQLLLVRVLDASNCRIEAVPVNDARKKDKIKEAKAYVIKAPNALCKWKCQKMLTTPLGDLRNAND